MTDVTHEDAISFLETAVRNWSHVPQLSKSDVEDVRAALSAFASRRTAVASLFDPRILKDASLASATMPPEVTRRPLGSEEESR